MGEYKISKDRPIFAKGLDFKVLILNSCENGKFHLIILFICSVFKHSVNSKEFNFKNPWINSILNLFSKLNGNTTVESGIKDEIKKLFKILLVDLGTWPKIKELEKFPIKFNSTFYGHNIDKIFLQKNK